MKIFNNLNQLWNYCLYCPVCQDYCRKILISGDATGDVLDDDLYFKVSFTKTDSFLYLEYNFDNKRIDYKIDLPHNTIVNFNAIEDLKEEYGIAESEIFFSIEGHCENCYKTDVYSTDFDLREPVIRYIVLEREKVVLIKNNFGFSIDIWYPGKFQISKVKVKPSSLISNEVVIAVSKPETYYNLPNINVDDLDKLYKKIQTIVTFS